MSNKKISELPVAGPLTPNDLFAVVQEDNESDLITYKISLADLTSGFTSRIFITATNLRILISNGGLKPGSFYVIDFQTKHLMPNTSVINTGTIEQLAMYALSENTISKQALSINHPEDIILFDINNILCEDSSTARDGKITYRKDTIKNLETWYDFRNVKFRRWQIDIASSGISAWAANHNYKVGDKITDGYIYRCLFDHNSSTGRDDTYWQLVLQPDTNFRIAWNTSINMGNIAINANAAVFSDYLTFESTLCSNISIKSMTDNSYNNIVFVESGGFYDSNEFGVNCNNMTIYPGTSKNKFGNNCSNVIMGFTAESNIIGNNTSQLYLVFGAVNNTIGNGVIGITLLFGASANTIGDEAFTSTIQSSSYCILHKKSRNNKIRNGSDYSEIGSGSGDTNPNSPFNDLSGNLILEGCPSTVIGAFSSGNRISQGSAGNRIGNYCMNNTIDSGSSKNTLGDNCNGNLFPHSSNFNRIGNSSSNNSLASSNTNTLGMECTGNILNVAVNNTFGNNCDTNTLGINEDSNFFNTQNSFGNGCSNNILNGGNIYNQFGNGCTSNRFGIQSSGNILGNSCSNNLIAWSVTITSGAFSYNRLGSNCNNNIIRGNGNVLGEGCSTISFASAFASNCYFTPGVQNKTFNAEQVGMRFEIADIGVKTYANDFSKKVADMQSPDGNIWYNNINNLGIATAVALA